MVHESIPRVLYEYPVVEYIPVHVTTLASGRLPTGARVGHPTGGPELIALVTEEAWSRVEKDFVFALPPRHTDLARQAVSPDRRDLVMLALGLRVEAGIYRASRVILVAAATEALYHLFSFRTDRFYRSRVDVSVHSTDGRPLARIDGVSVRPRPAWNV